MRIVFMGTPDFAEESLRALLEAGEDVAAVFTQPDKPRGRGMQESFSPVKTLAVERGIPVYQPVTFKDGAATELLRTLAPELLVVVAYGRILPQTFLDVAKYGSILHKELARSKAGERGSAAFILHAHGHGGKLADMRANARRGKTLHK